MVYFPNCFCTHGKWLLPTLTKCTHIWKHWKQSQSTTVLIHLSQNHNVTPCKNQYILVYIIETKLCCLLVTYCTGLIQVLIFNKMQIPCHGYVCFLLNNVCCCDGTFMRTISSVIIASAPGLPLVSVSRRSLGLPAKVLQLLEGPWAVLKGQV